MKSNFDDKKSILCLNIEWDTDGCDAAALGLPDSVTINSPSIEMIDDIEEYNGAIDDYLSDEYGYCIKGFVAELIVDNER